jgi:hypothetical protein
MAVLVFFDAPIPGAIGPAATEWSAGPGGPRRSADVARLGRHGPSVHGWGEEAHLRFLRQVVDTWLGWAGGFVSSVGLTDQKAVQALLSTLGPGQGGMAQQATFLDAFNDIDQHTGVEAIARPSGAGRRRDLRGEGMARGSVR